MGKQLIISIDVGGTYYKSAVIDVLNMIILPDSSIEVPSFSLSGKEQVFSALFSVVSQQVEFCNAHAKNIGRQVEILRIVFDFPGPFNYSGGFCMMHHKFADIYKIPLEPQIREYCNIDNSIPINFHHDLHAFSYGVYLYELNKKAKNLFCITLGTGLGTGFIHEGNIVMKPSGDPQYPIFQKPYKNGILEDFVSNRGLVQIYKNLTGREDCNFDAKKIEFLADRESDQKAKKAYEEMGTILGEEIHSLIQELNVDTLILGGQISKGFHLFGPAMAIALSDISTLRIIRPTGNLLLNTILGAASIPIETYYSYRSGNLNEYTV